MAKSFIAISGPYKGCKVRGPYLMKRDGRYFVCVCNWSGIKSYNILLSRYIMECHLERKLSRDEQVHHKDECVDNDVIDNLEVVMFKKHQSDHMKKRMNKK